MNILALDLGTHFGYAILSDEKIISGTKKLKNKTFGNRFSEFIKWLYQILDCYEIEKVYFERVRRHLGTEAGHIYGAFMYLLAIVCEDLKIPYEGCEVREIKKYITGHGRATKDDVVKAVSNLGFSPTDDNEADAISILLLAIAKKEGQPLNGHYGRKILCQTKLGPSSNLRERSACPQDLASDRGFLGVDLAHYHAKILEDSINEGLRS